MANIDEELTEQGVRYPVYAWVQKDGYYAKFEQFLGDYKDIKRLAELHSASKFGFQNIYLLLTSSTTLVTKW